MKRKQIKALIELANSVEEADEIIETYTPYKQYFSKIAYLQGMFDCEIVRKHTENKEADYKAILASIVNMKWR